MKLKAGPIHEGLVALLHPSDFWLPVCRLMNELTGFMLGHRQEQKRKQQQQEDSKRQEQEEKKSRKRYPPPRKLRAAMKGQLDGFHYHR